MPESMVVDDDADTQLELARVHKRLEENEERFRTIYEQSPIGIEIYTAGGRLAHVNKACLNIFGITDVSEIMGFDLMKDPNIPDKAKKRLQQGLNARYEMAFDFGKVKEHNLYKTTKAGVVHLDVQITPLGLSVGQSLTGYLVQIVDINDHKRAVADREQTLSQLRATLDATVDGIIVVGLDSKIKVFSKRFKKILRIPDSVLDSKDAVKALNHVLDRLKEPEVFSMNVRDALADPDSNISDKLYLKDGRILEVYSRPQKLDGKMIGRVWGFRDVTEQKRLELQLLQARKMEAIGTLTGGIAHDYNNLLSIIMGNLSLAMEEATPGSLLADVLNEADMASRKVRDLTHKLMALSRGGAPIKKVGSLEELLKSISDLIPADGGISLKKSIPPDLWPFPHDSFKMGTVFRNVMINSLEAMPGGGTLEIKAENLTVAHGSTGADLPLNPGDYVHISFHDQGTGIAEEHLEKLFDPYFSTKAMGVQKGMGLGLATAYAIVQKHGGQTVIRSKPGEGTTVSIYLPAEREVLEETGAMTKPYEKKNLKEALEKLFDGEKI